MILYTRNIRSREAVAAQLRALQRVRRPFGAPLLTLIDQEGGLVARLPGAPAGSAMRMAPRGAAYVRGQGRLTAANLRAAGVNVDLAPVVDLGRPGSYEVRFERTFGSSPATVGTLGAAFAQGLRQGGVAATLKQFPGLGGVRGDTDRATQRVPLSRAALRRDDEAPLRAGIRAGAHDPASSQAGLDAVVAAVRSGRLSRSGLLASAQRVLTLRRTLR